MSATFPPQSILVPIDFAPPSEAALRHARDLARLFGARVSVLHAQPFEFPPYFDPGVAAALLAEMRAAHGAAAEHVREIATAALGFSPEVAVADGPPAAVILQALAGGIDLAVLGTHGRKGAARAFLGSVAETVIRLAPCPVVVVRAATELESYRTILAAVGPGAAARTALERAAAIAALAGARLVTVHVADPDAPAAELPDVAAIVAGRAEIEETLASGDVATAILTAALARRADLVVVGSTRRKGLRAALGSVPQRVVRLAAAPVLVVPVEGEGRYSPAARGRRSRKPR